MQGQGGGLELPPTPSCDPTYTLTIAAIDCPLPALLHFLVDGHNLQQLHPLIVAVEETQEPQQVPGSQQVTAKFSITDQVPILGCLKSKVVYPAQVWYVGGVKPETQTTEVWWRTVTGGVTVVHRQHIMTLPSTQGGGSSSSSLQQDTWIKAPRLLHAFVVKTARKAHAESLQRLEQHFKQYLVT